MSSRYITPDQYSIKITVYESRTLLRGVFSRNEIILIAKACSTFICFIYKYEELFDNTYSIIPFMKIPKLSRANFIAYC